MDITGDDPAAGPDGHRPPAPDAAPGRDSDRGTDRSDDDRDIGWGDDLALADDADRGRRWYDEQRPPHWE